MCAHVVKSAALVAKLPQTTVIVTSDSLGSLYVASCWFLFNIADNTKGSLLRKQTYTKLPGCLPVQMKGSDFCIVSLKVGEVEEVWRGLLLPGLPAGKRGQSS